MSKRIKGIIIELDGETKGLDKALSDVNKKSRDLQKELRDVDRLLKFNPGNAELIAQKQKLLSQEVENTREKLNRLKEAQKDVDKAFAEGKISEEQYRAFQRELVETESKLKHFESQLQTSKTKMQEFGESMSAAGEKVKAAGDKMTSAGKEMSKKVTAPLVGIGTVAAKIGSDFEAGMSKVGAISGATGSDLQTLEDKARQLGATTQFSASEAADALGYMAMAGWDTQQMLGGIDGVMALAAASGEDLAMVSDIVTDALTAFGMKAEDSGRFADVLAAASSNANTNVAMLGESFKYVAPLAGALGYSAEDVSLALGLMANAGIKGSQAGTSLKTMFANLAKPTKAMQDAMDDLGISLTDSEGNMKTMDTVMKDLRKAFADLDETQQAQYSATIFGKEAMAGALAIINASEEDYNKLSEAINNSEGAAQRMADQMTDNLQGRLKEMKSALEEAAITIYKNLQPALEALIAFIQKLADWFNDLSPAAQNTIVVLAGIAAAIGPLLVVLGTLITSFGTVMTAVGGMATAIASAGGVVGALGSAFAVLINPIGLTVAALAALTAGGIALYNHLKKDAIPEVARFGEGVSEATQEAVGAFMDMSEQADIALKELAWSQETVTAEMAENMKSQQQEITDTLLNAINDRHTQEIEQAQEQLQALEGLSEEQKNSVIEKLNEKFAEEKKLTEEGHAQISEIYEQAANNNRGITEEEAKKILSIRESMTVQAVKVMSESEAEQTLIYEKMKNNASTISAREAAEVVKNATKKKDDVIKEANKQYDDTYKWAIRQRDELGTLSAEEANEVIKEAERQRESTIQSAEEKHKKIVEEAKKQAKEHVDEVDWETGEVLSKWEMFKKNTSKKFTEIRKDISDKWEGMKKDARDKTLELITDAAKKYEEMKTDAVEKMKGMYTGVKEKFEDIRSTAKEKFDAAKKVILDPIEEARDKVETAIDAIKSFFDNLKLKLPEIEMPKLPKFKMEGSFSLNPPSVPKLSVQWHAKGGIFNKPTIFDTKAGLHGVGEAGAEAIIPLTDEVLGKIGNKIADRMEHSAGNGNMQSTPVINQTVNINSPQPTSPSENARKMLQASRRLAMEWK